MKFIPMYDSWLLLAALAKRLKTEELVNVLGNFKAYASWHVALRRVVAPRPSRSWGLPCSSVRVWTI